ncbi:hypothetical protein LR48_Vigan246s000700 [Vigna angularis]|uniref:Gcp-like domain-containing protein n=1 Tax=Phaseolus angularis TaxID=3914 RepID=A0A0L9T859_PHAAN|nr:hypothetical protein LR48_Vigan246s000700 [Vigna angularis]
MYNARSIFVMHCDAKIPISSASEEDRMSRADIAASFQRTAVLHLEERCERAIQWALKMEPSIRHLVVSGGVASNQYVRARLDMVAKKNGLQLLCPPPRLCTDNGPRNTPFCYHLPFFLAPESLAPSSSSPNRAIPYLLNVSTDGDGFDVMKDIYQGQLVPLKDIPNEELEVEIIVEPTEEVVVEEGNEGVDVTSDPEGVDPSVEGAVADEINIID